MLKTLIVSLTFLTFLPVIIFISAAESSAQDSVEAAAVKAPPRALADGEALYMQRCKSCHEGTVEKAPPHSLLSIMSAPSILTAMETGVMQSQAKGLTKKQRTALAEYLTGQSLSATTASAPPRCKAGVSEFDFQALPAAQGWGNNLRNHRFIPATQAGMTAQDLPKLKLKWALAYPNAIRARSEPVTAGGALFVGSHDGTVYSLDQKTGCVRWSYKNVAEVRTSLVVEPWGENAEKQHPLLFFGDLIGHVHAVDAVTGKLVWKTRAGDHPSLTLTATPVLFENKLYVPLSSLEVTAAADPEYACCTFRGGVAVYEAATGKHLWTTHTIAEPGKVVGKNSVGTDRIAPSGAPIWGVPTIDQKRRRIYVGTGENYSSPADDSSDAIIAFDLDDGDIVWKQQMTKDDAWNMGCEAENQANCPPEDGPDYDFGAATILAKNNEGREILLAGQKSGEVFGLDPDDGKILWRNKLGRGGIQGGVHFGMALDNDVLYVPISDFVGGDRWPGVAKPGMYAVDITTGKLLWSAPAEDVCAGRELCQPGISAAATAIPGAVLGGGMDGHLRAYASDSGKVIWDFDTAKEFMTVSGERASGGSLGGAAGPVFKDGMMFVNSGYGIYFHMPGNVLLAFGLERDNISDQ